MESQKIINLLDHKDEDDPKFETNKWYIVNDHNSGNYGQGDDVQSTLKFNTEIVKPFLCSYADAYVLVTGDITVEAGDNNTRVAFKNCCPFTSPSFKYQTRSIQKKLTEDNSTVVVANIDPNFNVAHRLWKNIKIVVPLKYISNFLRSLKLPLINTKLYTVLNWAK